MPKVSFAMPTFKGAFLEKAIRSILNQSYEDFELIIVNDASPDDIDAIVSSFSDVRIKYYLNSENIGGRNLVENWNHCLSLATGNFFVLASDDDEYHPDFLLELLPLTQKYPQASVFHSRVNIIDRDSNITGMTIGCPEWESAEDFLWHRINRSRIHFIPEFLFRTEKLQKQGFIDFSVAWGSDNATVVEMGNGGGIVASNKALLNWRASGLNISDSSSYSFLKMKGLFQYISWLDEFVDRVNGEWKALLLREIPRFKISRVSKMLSRETFLQLIRAFFSLKIKGFPVKRTMVIRAFAFKLSRFF